MKHDYLIVANGPFLVKEILQEAALNKKIVALDGAANKLRKMDIKPDIILGDFDSIEDPSYWGIHATFDEMLEFAIPYLGKDEILIVPKKDQSQPDISKAIAYCDKQAAKSITLICALGGRLDLHENALKVLRHHYRRDRNITLHTEQHSVLFCKNEKLTITGVVGEHCSILAFPDAIVNTTGLKYDLLHYDLKKGKADSICNTLAQTEAEIAVSGEALVILPPVLNAQRDFMQKSKKAKKNA
jgi:thiamine pyrophosphokinase